VALLLVPALRDGREAWLLRRLFVDHQRHLAQPGHQWIALLEAKQQILAQIGRNLFLDAGFGPDYEALEFQIFDMRFPSSCKPP
jgi:hypothetical protein